MLLTGDHSFRISRRGLSDAPYCSQAFARVTGVLPDQNWPPAEAIPFVTGFGDEWVRVGAVKVVADGGHSAGHRLLREPYGTHTEVYGYDDPNYRARARGSGGESSGDGS